MRKLVVVLDTNVWLSGLLWRGAPHEIVRLAECREVVITASPPIMTELSDALSRQKFSARLSALGSSTEEVMEAALSVVDIMDAPEIHGVVPDDPDDDKIIASAVAAGADWIVSGDRHLFRLRAYRGITIGTPIR